MWNEHNCTAAWTLFGIALLWDWNENWPFLVLWPLLSFPNLVTIYSLDVLLPQIGKVVWYSHLFKNFPQFVVIHTIKGFSIINEAEVGVFLELLLFRWSNRCWQFDLWFLCVFKIRLKHLEVHGSCILKPGLENFEHHFTGLWDECNCVVVWTFLALPFFGIGVKTDLFQSCGHCWVFQLCWHIEWSTFTASSFRIWNSSMEYYSAIKIMK